MGKLTAESRVSTWKGVNMFQFSAFYIFDLLKLNINMNHLEKKKMHKGKCLKIKHWGCNKNMRVAMGRRVQDLSLELIHPKGEKIRKSTMHSHKKVKGSCTKPYGSFDRLRVLTGTQKWDNKWTRIS